MTIEEKWRKNEKQILINPIEFGEPSSESKFSLYCKLYRTKCTDNETGLNSWKNCSFGKYPTIISVLRIFLWRSGSDFKIR